MQLLTGIFIGAVMPIFAIGGWAIFREVGPSLVNVSFDGPDPDPEEV